MIHVNEMAELMNDHIVNDFKGRHRKTVVKVRCLEELLAPLRSRLLNGEGFRRDFQLLLIDLNPFPDHLLATGKVELFSSCWSASSVSPWVSINSSSE